MSDVIFLTHAEVEIDPQVPVPEWGLNAVGWDRHTRFADDPVLDGIRAVFSSTERKACDAAAAVADKRGLVPLARADLGENDRSATGYLPPEEFWPVVAQFFAEPQVSVRGWERACDAQARVVDAVGQAVAEAPPGDVLIVAHGGVGTLLWCHLAGRDISQAEGQPHPGGGCWFAFDRAMTGPPTDWRAI